MPVPVWAVVPVKPFVLAKRRLSEVLSGVQRAHLAQAMFEDVLTRLGQLRNLAGVLVVTADAGAARMASNVGALVLAEPYPRGLNAAVTAAATELAMAQAGMLVVPIDVPHVTVGTLDRAVDVLRQRPAVVLAPARTDGGTNLFGCTPAARLPTCFGRGSFLRHCTSARRAGIVPVVIDDERVGRDIDTPDDLSRALAFDGAARTQQVLSQIVANGRVHV